MPTEVAAPMSLRALLSDILDYAGMFPPAALSLDDALSRYIDLRATPESWIVARFICPAARLDDLVRAYAAAGTDDVLRVSVLLRTPESGNNLHADWTHELEVALRAHADGQIRVEAFELRLPDSLSSAREVDMAEFVPPVIDRIERASMGADLFFEAPKDSHLQHATSAMVAALKPHRRQVGAFTRVGLKFRCGGESSSFIPDTAKLASAIILAVRQRVPFKATAGLHNPIRSYNRSLSAWTHGFVNVFAAAILGSVHDLTSEAIEQILLSDEPKEFSFMKNRLRWRDLHATTEEIIRIRRDLALAFGSCSVDEPVRDLRAMGLM